MQKILDIVIPMYNLLEHSDNYSITSGSLWNYNRNETSGVDDNASQSKSFEYNKKNTRKTTSTTTATTRPRWNSTLRPPRPPWPQVSISNVEVTVPVKYLSSFWRSLDLPLINYEVEFDLLWKKRE